jgi:hypothetical protein
VKLQPKSRRHGVHARAPSANRHCPRIAVNEPARDRRTNRVPPAATLDVPVGAVTLDVPAGAVTPGHISRDRTLRVDAAVLTARLETL